MNYSLLRLLEHIMFISWFITTAYFALLARGRSVRLAHVPSAIGGLVFMAAWFGLLAISLRESAIIPRSDIIPLLAALELGGLLCAWIWLILTAREVFAFKFDRRGFHWMRRIPLFSLFIVR